MPGQCTIDNLVYRATVTTNTKTETYVGLTGGQFKDRFYKHKGDFEDPNRRTSTKLSEYIWSLKDQNIPYSLKWEMVRRAQPFSPIAKKCDLCVAEKFEIIYKSKTATLNKRHELFNHCRHRARLFLTS